MRNVKITEGLPKEFGTECVGVAHEMTRNQLVRRSLMRVSLFQPSEWEYATATSEIEAIYEFN